MLAVMLPLFYNYLTKPIREDAKEMLGLDETPDFLQILSDQIDFLFHNGHPILGAVAPINPNTALLAGLHVTKPDRLPGDIQEILNSSKDGIILVSFGSVISKSYN